MHAHQPAGMQRQATPPAKNTQQAAAASTTPLGDNRFQELIRGASAFFAQAERDVVAEKAAMIREIQGRMAEYGLTLADLED